MEHGLSGEYIKYASVEVHFISENVREESRDAEGRCIKFRPEREADASALFTSDGTDGLKSLRVLSGAVADRAGNTNDATETFQWTLDTRLPTVTLSGRRKIDITCSLIEFSLSSDNPVRSMQGTTSTKTRRPSHALDMSYDEENAISTDSADVPSDTQKLHGL